MDRARQRFADNVELLKSFNPALAVMGDRDWTNNCENSYVQHMAKKLWMHPFTQEEVENVNKAVTGYLYRESLKANANPVQAGGRVIKGKIFSVKKTCEHEDAEDCTRHYRMNVRDAVDRNTIYTPIPRAIYEQWLSEEIDLIGRDVSFYAYITVSERDKTFGFAHRPKLMEIKEG
jgi:hypothetical protein